VNSRLPSLGPRGEGWVAIQFGLLPVIVGAGYLGPAWGEPIRTMTTVAGALLLAAGGLLGGRGVLDLRENLTPLPHPKEGARLVEAGAYRLVRHPIYGGLVLAAFGWGLLAASPAALAAAVVLLVFFDLKSRREEAWLEARFPDYPAYRARSHRLIPWLY
jgi:protein-S-isoprenylcysteine O-methyltransferase Ste14